MARNGSADPGRHHERPGVARGGPGGRRRRPGGYRRRPGGYRRRAGERARGAGRSGDEADEGEEGPGSAVDSASERRLAGGGRSSRASGALLGRRGEAWRIELDDWRPWTLVDAEREHIGARVVADDVEVVLGFDDLVEVQVGPQDGLLSERRPGEDVPEWRDDHRTA